MPGPDLLARQRNPERLSNSPAGGQPRVSRTHRDRPASRQAESTARFPCAPLRCVVACAMVQVSWWPRSMWPQLDPNGCKFLGRAFNDVGTAIYASDWTGHEWDLVGQDSGHTQ